MTELLAKRMAKPNIYEHLSTEELWTLAEGLFRGEHPDRPFPPEEGWMAQLGSQYQEMLLIRLAPAADVARLRKNYALCPIPGRIVRVLPL